MTAGTVRLKGRDLLALAEAQRRARRGAEIAVVFQDPMSAFNPVLTIGAQLVDFQYHRAAARTDKRARA